MNVNYHDDWRERVWKCGNCGWQGPGTDLGTGEMFDELMEMDCPSCYERILVVSYPTLSESRENWSKMSVLEREYAEAIARFSERFEAASLKAASQLPELEGDDLVLEWDFIESDTEQTGRFSAIRDTVIRHGEFEVWREPALWEGYERFLQVLGMLRERYGDRLKDLIPTKASRQYLYGDSLSADVKIERAREALGRAQ
ncbi:MAG: hypothetical protein EA424_17790 [Planctomycetaceae bacterium]|nr:MAG: hypothetical protein EA424_17790 [Planctomycetaceae bacterium]